MPIIRTCDWYTSMGPGDVLLSGWFSRNPEAPDDPEGADGMMVTPRQCRIAEKAVPPGSDVFYELTLPGRGEVQVVGACMAYSPLDSEITNEDIVWAKWDYNNADRVIHIELRKEQPSQGDSVQLQYDQETGEYDKVYFCIHLLQSGNTAANTIIVENP